METESLSLLALFTLSFAAATVVPFSSEAALGVVVSRADGWAVPVVVATLGNTLGACTTYWIGRASRRLTPELSGRTERAASLLQRYGAPALLLSWVPVIGDALVALAGAARMRFGHFAIWTALGKLARYLALALAVASW